MQLRIMLLYQIVQHVHFFMNIKKIFEQILMFFPMKNMIHYIKGFFLVKFKQNYSDYEIHSLTISKFRQGISQGIKNIFHLFVQLFDFFVIGKSSVQIQINLFMFGSTLKFFEWFDRIYDKFGPYLLSQLIWNAKPYFQNQLSFVIILKLLNFEYDFFPLLFKLLDVFMISKIFNYSETELISAKTILIINGFLSHYQLLKIILYYICINALQQELLQIIMEITNFIIQLVNQPKMEQFNLNNQGQFKVQFTPFLSFTRQCVLQKLQSIQNSDNLFGKMIKCIKNKTIYIGLLDIKQQNLNLLFKNIEFTKRANNDQPVLYISQYVQQSNEIPFRFVYLSNQKNDSQHHALLASILMTVSSSIVYQFNSKYVRSSKQSQTRYILLKQLGYENTQSDQFVLISQKAKSDVYKISLTQNNRMQIKQKFSFPTDIMNHLTLNNCQKTKKIQLSLLKQCFQFYWNKYMHLFQEKHSQQLQQLIFLTLTFFVKLQNQVKFYQYLIKKEQYDQQVQQSNVFFTFQNFQSLKTCLKSFLLSNNSKQKIRETILKIILQQIQLFKQESLIKILQNLQNQYFCSKIGKQESQKSVNYLLESEQLKIKEQQIAKKLLSQNIKSEYLSIVTHHYQTNLMKNHIKVLQLKISQQELCIQAGQNQIVQKSIKISYLQSQLEEQSKRNFLLKQISQQLQIMQQKLYQANLDKRTLKMDIQTYLNQIKQFKQREVRLQGIINAHREQKNNMLQAIGILTKENLQYLCKIKQKDQTIKQLQQKNYHLQHIERLIIKEKQKNMILQQNLNQFKKYHDQIEKKWTCFKERQLVKFNFILSENWNQYQKQLKKTEYLQAKIQKFQLEFQNIQKQKKMMEIQVEYFQKVFYEKTCGGIIESQMNNSRQKPFYQMSNIHKMQQIFESIEEDFTTDRIKESQIQFDKVKSLQNQPKQLRISNF